MSKKDLVAMIVAEKEMSKKEAEEVVNLVFSAMSDTLAQGEKVSIHGFGNFDIRERAARTGRNPQTGEAIKIAASKSVGFKAAKALKESL